MAIKKKESKGEKIEPFGRNEIVKLVIVAVLLAFAVLLFIFLPPFMKSLGLSPLLQPGPGAGTVSDEVENQQSECEFLVKETGRENYNYMIYSNSQEAVMTMNMTSRFISSPEGYSRDTEMKSESITLKMHATLDNEYNCVAVKLAIINTSTGMNMVAGGTEMTDEGECQGKLQVTKACLGSVVYIGEEEITVPFGTFDAKVWESADGTRIWTSESLTVPVKLVSQDSEMLLVEVD